MSESGFLPPNDIYQGDVRDLLPRVSPESLALSFWSPPYFVGKSYPIRLLGKIDYKRATYLFQPEYAIRQTLFVDSKAEKRSGARIGTIPKSQPSMHIRQIRRDQPINVLGDIDTIAMVRDVD